MSLDPFSDILNFTKTQSLVTGGFTAGGPWALRFPAPDKIKFFAVVKGNCWILLDGEKEPIAVEAGDVCLLSAPRAFTLASHPSVAPMDAMGVFRGPSGSHFAQLGNGEEFSHLGGHVLLDPVSGRLLADVLPPWIQIRASSPQATAFRWLLEQLVEERANQRPGAILASAQLAQLLFIQILRAHLESSILLPSGWLRALSHPSIAPALRLIHGEPGRAWHLDELAQAASMSRTTFAVTFKQVMGVPPLTYLLNWRMSIAERALREATTPVAVLAETLGYASESAFSNAFKRVNGLAPKRYRDQQAPATPSTPTTAPSEPSVQGAGSRSR